MLLGPFNPFGVWDKHTFRNFPINIRRMKARPYLAALSMIVATTGLGAVFCLGRAALYEPEVTFNVHHTQEPWDYYRDHNPYRFIKNLDADCPAPDY